MTVSSPQEVLLRLAFAPSRRRTAYFRLKDTVELRARGEPTLGRDHVVAVMGVLQHHALCSAKTNIAHLTSSLRHPKILIKEFSYFLMPCHQHGLRINLLV